MSLHSSVPQPHGVPTVRCLPLSVFALPDVLPASAASCTSNFAHRSAAHISIGRLCRKAACRLVSCTPQQPTSLSLHSAQRSPFRDSARCNVAFTFSGSAAPVTTAAPSSPNTAHLHHCNLAAFHAAVAFPSSLRFARVALSRFCTTRFARLPSEHARVRTPTTSRMRTLGHSAAQPVNVRQHIRSRRRTGSLPAPHNRSHDASNLLTCKLAFELELATLDCVPSAGVNQTPAFLLSL